LSSETNDISTSGSYNRYLKKTEKNADDLLFDLNKVDNLKQTACFSPLNEDSKRNNFETKIIPPINVGNSNIKKKVTCPIPASKTNQANSKKLLNMTTSPNNIKPNTMFKKIPSSREKSLQNISFKEDVPKASEGRVSSRPSSTSKLPTISSKTPNSTKNMNFEINNIFKIADQYKEDTELQDKINVLVKNIIDIKSVLRSKRTNIRSALNSEYINKTPSIKRVKK
jgi:hypothetical protein